MWYYLYASKIIVEKEEKYMKNYYKVLGISESATVNEIVDAYKILAPQYHPDNNKGDDYAQERFIDLSVAYKTLINSDIRKDYDRILKGTLEADPNSKVAAANIDISDSISQNGEHNTKLSKTVRYVAIFSILFIVASIIITIVKVVDRDSHSSSIVNTQPTTITNKNNDNKSLTPTATTTTKKDDVENTAKTNKSNAPVVITKPTTVPNTTPKDNSADKRTDVPETITDISKDKTTPTSIVPKKETKTAVDQPVKAAPTFDVKSTKSQVLNIQGTPTSIVRYEKNTEVWSYGNSKVTFVNGEVATFRDTDHNLKIQKGN